MTPADIDRLLEMNFPAGCENWTHAENYATHREWRARRNSLMGRIVAFVTILGGLSIYIQIGAM